VNGTCTAANNATVTILAPNVATITTAPTSFCLGSVNTASLVANAVSSPQSGAWSVTTQPAGANATFTNASNNNTTANGLAVSGAYTFTWTVSNGGVCAPVASSVDVTMDATVTASAADVSICETTVSAALNATTPLLGTGAWSTGTAIVIANPLDGHSALSNLSAGTFSFLWTVTNGTCQATAPATLTIDQAVTATLSSNLITGCGSSTGSVQLTADVPPSGTGTWTIVAPGTGTISDTHLHDATLSGLAVPSITQLTWTVVSGTCSASATLNVAIQSSPTSVAGTDQNLCESGGTSANISGSQQVGETGVWTVVSGNGTITDITSANTSVTGLTPGGTLVLQWEVTATACGTSDSDQITIRLDNTPQAIVDADQTNCETAGTSATLNATAGVGSWSVVTGTGTVTSTSSANTTITGLTVGQTTTVTWTVPSSFGVCASATDNLNITVERVPVADAGTNFSTCLTSTSLSASTLSAGVWTVTAGTGILTDDANPLTSVSNLSFGLNEFTWTVNGTTSCTSVASVVQVMNTTSDLDVTVTGDGQTLCAGAERLATVGVTSSTGSGNYIYYWSDVNGTALFHTTDPIVSFVPGPGLTTYYVVVADANQVGCNADIDSVKISAMGEQNLQVPNLMTPNGDGENDVLKILDENKDPLLPGSYLQVVNRWGEQVYESEDYRNTWKAPNTSDGMYFYYLKAGCGGRVYKGWVHILGNVKP